MKDKIKPTLVLTIICVIASLLLVLAYESTKDKIAEQKEIKFNSSVESLFGKCESRLLDDNFGNDDIMAIAVTNDGKTAIQVCVEG